MGNADTSEGESLEKSGLLVLEDGSMWRGVGLGAEGVRVGELCFNTAMTGYQEVLTDPSYAGQIITFTFPHIGNVGTNEEDLERGAAAALGFVVRDAVTPPSSFRNEQRLTDWAASRGLVGLSGVDTRSLTLAIRKKGVMKAAIAHDEAGQFDVDALRAAINDWPGLEGMELAETVTRQAPEAWAQKRWQLGTGYSDLEGEAPHVVAIDYGAKDTILRCLADAGARITVVPATTSAADILAHRPDGIFLSNGPGDPAATGAYALPVINELIDSGKPIFGICLGHQLLALALGGSTFKMHQGHRGANHPVQDKRTGKVEITSMNHGFAVAADSLPGDVTVSHISLFDGTVCGLAHKTKPIFSVQQHPEASPGPQDSFYLFEEFLSLIKERGAA